MAEIIQIEHLVVDQRARDWCRLPYPRHPHGCPNYGQRDTCPPEAPMIDQFFDLGAPLWLVAVQFDLAAHRSRMMAEHPHWSEAQANCCLYWQNGVRRELEALTKRFAFEHGFIYTLCPEAMGVHVIKTARKAGLPVVPRPDGTVYKIAFAGAPSTEAPQK